MPRNDALIFDIDGTLWNASPASAKGWNLGLAKLGIDRQVSPAQVETVAGHPFAQCVELLLPGLRTQYPELLDILDEYETLVVKSEGGKFYDGVRDGITQLANTYEIFLVSNCQAWYLDLFLDFSGLRPVLAGFDCHGLSGSPKHAMLTRIKTDHALNRPVYIGDTAGDEAAAKEATMAFLHVGWGFGRPAGATKTVHSFAELVESLSLADNF